MAGNVTPTYNRYSDVYTDGYGKRDDGGYTWESADGKTRWNEDESFSYLDSDGKGYYGPYSGYSEID